MCAGGPLSRCVRSDAHQLVVHLHLDRLKAHARICRSSSRWLLARGQHNCTLAQASWRPARAACQDSPFMSNTRQSWLTRLPWWNKSG